MSREEILFQCIKAMLHKAQLSFIVAQSELVLFLWSTRFWSEEIATASGHSVGQKLEIEKKKEKNITQTQQQNE